MAEHTKGRITRKSADTCMGIIGNAFIFDSGMDLHLSPANSTDNARRLAAGWNLLERLDFRTSEVEDFLARDLDVPGSLLRCLTTLTTPPAKGDSPAGSRAATPPRRAGF